jgi:uncharacterized membrane protein
MTTKTATTVVLLLFAIGLGASLVLYPSLPARMPIHWNIHGNVDGWAGKPFGSLGLPALMLLFLLFILAGEWLSPAHFKISPFRASFNYLMVICATLMFYIHALVLAAALHPHRGAQARWMIGGLFVFFAWMGNLLGKTRRNFWIGIRTPWTLASDAVWIATHRLGARIFVAAGIIGAIAAALGVSPVWCFLLLMVAMFVPVFYSLWLSKKLEKPEVTSEE